MEPWSGAMTSWCTTRVCEGSAAEVAALLQGYAVGRTRLVAGPAVLTLDEDSAAPGVTPVVAARIRGARLRYARGRPAARVSVEVEPWSPDRCEIVVRPARRRPPGGDAYFRAAAGLLEALVLDLGLERLRSAGAEAGPHRPLRRAS